MELTHEWGPHLEWLWIALFLAMVFLCLFVAFRIRRGDGWGRGSGHHGLWAAFGCRFSRKDARPRRRIKGPRRILDRRSASGEITRLE
jgi:hypothetical protein